MNMDGRMCLLTKIRSLRKEKRSEKLVKEGKACTSQERRIAWILHAQTVVHLRPAFTVPKKL